MSREIGINTDITLTHLAEFTLARLTQYIAEEIKDEPIENTKERRSTKRKCQDDMAETERKANMKMRAAKQKTEMEKQEMEKQAMKKLEMEKRAAKKTSKSSSIGRKTKTSGRGTSKSGGISGRTKTNSRRTSKSDRRTKCTKHTKIKENETRNRD